MASPLVDKVQSALKLHQAGDVSAALSLYEEVLLEKQQLNAPVVSTLANNAGSILMSMGQYEMAAGKFKLAIESSPDKADCHYNYAVVLNSKLKDNAKALKHCGQAMKLDPNFYKAYHLMGNILQDLGRPDEADPYFTKAEEIAKSLGVDDPNVIRSGDSSSSFDLGSIWMFQVNEEDKTFEIPLSPKQQDILGRETLSVRCLSLRPLVFEIPDFLLKSESQHVMDTATPKLEHSHVMGSRVSHEPAETPTEPYRTSYNAWLPLDDVLISLQERISLVTGLPIQYLSMKSEELQVVKYEEGGQFKMHQDSSSFNPRLLTALVYLESTIEKRDTKECSLTGGGEGDTFFPFGKSNRSIEETNERSKSSVDEILQYVAKSEGKPSTAHGLAVHPSPGKAIIFFNHLKDGSIDPLAVHSGTKISEGTKWIANYWVKLDLEALKQFSKA